MHLLRRSVALLALWAAPVLPGRAESSAVAPDDVVKKAYHLAIANFGFSPENLRPEKPWLTESLYSGLRKKADQPTPKGDVADIDGDVFTDSQDLPTRYEVGGASIEGDRAKVEVDLVWSKEKRRDTVLLKQVGGAWKIDDIVYQDDGTLRGLLK
jgi:hypothetical protein